MSHNLTANDMNVVGLWLSMSLLWSASCSTELDAETLFGPIAYRTGY